jgi:SAM-dependent methyltransferase
MGHVLGQIVQPLPDVSLHATTSTTVWSEFGDRLRAIGLTPEYTAAINPSSVSGPEGSSILTWHARQRDEPAAHVYRLFHLHDSITIGEAEQALGHTFVNVLVEAGVLICQEAGRIVSAFDLQLFHDLFILCDDLSHGDDDAVFGVGPGTYAICRAITRPAIAQNALDLGCGAGAAALWAAKYAHRVVATDINPRALTFVKINSAINGITNVETRLGNLFDSVSGDLFDLIISQPPFVPRPSSARPATYRFGGPHGNELALRIIEQLPKHLATDGRGLVMFMQPIFAGSHEPTNELAAHCEKSCHALLIMGLETGADEFSVRYAKFELRRGLEEFDKAAVEMREHLESLDIRSISPAVCVLEHAPPSQGRFELLRAGCYIWDELSAANIERLLVASRLLQQPVSMLLRVRLRIPQSALVFRAVKDEEDEAGKLYLGLPPEYLIAAVSLTQSEWEFVRTLDRSDDVESALTSLATGPDAVQLREAALLTVSRLLRAGLFDIQT